MSAPRLRLRRPSVDLLTSARAARSAPEESWIVLRRTCDGGVRVLAACRSRAAAWVVRNEHKRRHGDDFVAVVQGSSLFGDDALVDQRGPAA